MRVKTLINQTTNDVVFGKSCCNPATFTSGFSILEAHTDKSGIKHNISSARMGVADIGTYLLSMVQSYSFLAN